MAESGGDPLYSCKTCRNPLAFQSDLLSKAFKAKSGQAYLFSHVMNVVLGKKQDRQLTTGTFTIADIYCTNCGASLGWKYVRAYDELQRYKKVNSLLRNLRSSRNTEDSP